eukprot:6364692-Amphidinium_carterae.1
MPAAPAKLPNAVESSDDEDEEDDRKCVICHQTLRNHKGIEAMHCGHLFHAACIRRWLSMSDRKACPLCRGVVTTSQPW